MLNEQVILTRRPRGIPQSDDFALRALPARSPDPGEILVANQYLSVDPAMRGWVADTDNYVPPVELDSVMRSLASGTVIESRCADYSVGDVVTGWFGWQRFATVPASSVIRRVDEADLPLSLSLGILGLNGATAFIALNKIGAPQHGDTVLVSTGGGSVGSAVGQIAGLMGCRTVAITGGPTKVKACLDTYHYHEALDYKQPSWNAQLTHACPDGVNVYFDNTAGAISDAVMPHLAIGARVVVCGTAAISSWSSWPSGPRVERHLLVKRARMEGFMLFDHMADYPQAIEALAEWVRRGELRYAEHFLDGLESCPDSIAKLYRGENDGKLLVRLT